VYYELNETKLPQLTELKYSTIPDAVDVLGPVAGIRDMFIDFQQHLYNESRVLCSIKLFDSLYQMCNHFQML